MFLSRACRAGMLSRKEVPNIICFFLMSMILLMLVSADGRQMPSTNQADNVIKPDKLSYNPIRHSKTLSQRDLQHQSFFKDFV